jgi:hypothetical protein
MVCVTATLSKGEGRERLKNTVRNCKSAAKPLIFIKHNAKQYESNMEQPGHRGKQ